MTSKWKLEMVISCEEMFAAADKSSDPFLWHERFCRMGVNNLQKLASDKLAEGINFNQR